MTRKRVWAYSRSELRYYAAAAGLALMAPLSLMTMLWLLPPAQAGGNWAVDGAGGVLEVRGAMTESACRLEMDSARQDIWLGEVATGRLQQLGDRGDPVAFALRLRDCQRSSTGSWDYRTGALSWAAYQPAVTVSFSAPADVDNPQLVKLSGVSGIGLRLTDEAGRDVRLGERGTPLLLTPGSNSLAYRVATERTRAPLSAGVYVATIDFRLNYD
ncbi:type 1 fimbrial protein [Serratia marcescens]|uniref:fimbrial protein n=1 Tax=Serratia marcescens TaxID=615 RepID=UPI0011E87172|nr:fimbrial protein [Serratia marcescens]MBH2879016.1 type 1 fimbrial protein [Serratia marcescens]